jgi:pyruvate dehydrogenase E2 component (dihydrolipoamide acetyltransferase)
MAEIVRMPKLSDTMTEGVVADWHKKVGDTVSSGDLLADIETDKATLEFESFYDGVLLHIGVEKGKGAPVNEILAIIGEKGEDVQALIAADNGGATETKKEETKKDVTPSLAPVSVPKQEPVVQQTAPQTQTNSDGRIIASPLAKKIAEEKGVNLTQVSGSGENGRIVKRDIENFVPSAQQSFVSAGQESFTDENVSQMRKTIARRLAESKFTAPHFYLTLDIDMDNAIAARKSINASGDVKVSFNDMVVKAVAMSLRKHPTINSAWMGDFIRRNQHVHIGVAVAVDEGLLVPVVRFADTKGFAQIGAEVKDFAQKAKDKKLQPADWEGNTFTISNLGMFGIESFTAIVNPPDSCIMAVGGIKEVPVVKNGQIVPGNVMKITLSCDHRVVDGASGAAFLQTFKQYMENPVTMLV